jgi:adenine-specific DNA-methyltransferase
LPDRIAQQRTAADQPTFPPTRYQGSKRKLLDWLNAATREIPGERAADLFCGTACVAWMLKAQDRAVLCNDLLASSAITAMALVENDDVRISDEMLNELMRKDRSATYDDFIARTFDGIYFTRDENRWLDVVVQNIHRLPDERPYERVLALHTLFQACLAKRPYNLFHRCNLYLRQARVPRSFGNKTTWDTSFERLFRRFARQANRAVFVGRHPCRVRCGDAAEMTGGFDLVYLDPPYVSDRGVSVDYLGFYHFLEGLADYANWPQRVDYASKHRCMQSMRSPWTDARTNLSALAAVLSRHPQAAWVISYRSDGLPTPRQIDALLADLGRCAQRRSVPHRYVLSPNRRCREVLWIALPK